MDVKTLGLLSGSVENMYEHTRFVKWRWPNLQYFMNKGAYCVEERLWNMKTMAEGQSHEKYQYTQ